MQRQIDRAGENGGEIADLRVDVARRDDHFFTAAAGEGGRVHDGRHADGVDRHAQRLFLEGGAGVPHAGAGNDAGVGHLDGRAQAFRRAGGQRVNAQNAARAHVGAGTADDLDGFHAGGRQNTRRNGADAAAGAEILRQMLDEVARQEEPRDGFRPQCVGRDGGVAEAGHEDAVLRAERHQAAQLLRDGAGCRTGILRPFRKLHGHIGPRRLPQRFLALPVADFHVGHGEALRAAFTGAHAAKLRRLPGGLLPECFGLQSQVCADRHACFLLAVCLSLPRKSAFREKFYKKLKKRIDFLESRSYNIFLHEVKYMVFR